MFCFKICSCVMSTIVSELVTLFVTIIIISPVSQIWKYSNTQAVISCQK